MYVLIKRSWKVPTDSYEISFCISIVVWYVFWNLFISYFKNLSLPVLARLYFEEFGLSLFESDLIPYFRTWSNFHWLTWFIKNKWFYVFLVPYTSQKETRCTAGYRSGLIKKLAGKQFNRVHCKQSPFSMAALSYKQWIL